MLPAVSGKPDHFRLGGVELKTVGSHPTGDVVYARGDLHLQFIDVSWTT
jgi:hypothetical protein